MKLTDAEIRRNQSYTYKGYKPEVNAAGFICERLWYTKMDIIDELTGAGIEVPPRDELRAMAEEKFGRIDSSVATLSAASIYLVEHRTGDGADDVSIVAAFTDRSRAEAYTAEPPQRFGPYDTWSVVEVELDQEEK